jgi:hypothetical protein
MHRSTQHKLLAMMQRTAQQKVRVNTKTGGIHRSLRQQCVRLAHMGWQAGGMASKQEGSRTRQQSMAHATAERFGAQVIYLLDLNHNKLSCQNR